MPTFLEQVPGGHFPTTPYSDPLNPMAGFDPKNPLATIKNNIGPMIGGAAGGLLGSAIGPVGTLAGSAAGNALGALVQNILISHFLNQQSQGQSGPPVQQPQPNQSYNVDQ